MIYIICGLIGAGKTTYAKKEAKENDIITDIDLDGTSKEEQLRQTMDYYNKGRTVYHITCYPTLDEQETFMRADVKYIWIGTSAIQAKTNIISRARPRDINDLQATLRKNCELLYKYASSKIKFNVVNVFATTEKW